MQVPECSKAQPQFSSTTQFQLMKSEKFQRSILIVPATSTTCRRFNLVKTSRDERTQYFACKRCYNLSKSHPVGTGRFSVRAYIFDDVLYMPFDARHHPDCKALANASVMAQGIDRTMREQVRRKASNAKEAFEKVRIVILCVACYSGVFRPTT